MIDEKKLIEFIKSNDFKRRIIQSKDSIQDILVQFITEQQKVGEWIPCSERLPELQRVDMESEGEYYMISDSVIITDGENIGLTKYEVDDDVRKGWLECEFEGNEDIVAWMPLPEPYKGE